MEPKMHCTSAEINFNMRCFGLSVDIESSLTVLKTESPHYSFEVALLSVTSAFFSTRYVWSDGGSAERDLLY